MNAYKTMAVALSGVALWTLAAPSGASAEEIKLTAISGHPPITASVKNLRDFFIPQIDKRLAAKGSKSTIKWTQAYAGAVAKPPAVFEAIEQGIGDIGHVPVLFEAAKMPLEQVTYVTPFGTDDLVQLTEVINKLHAKVPEMTKAYEKYNQVYLAPLGVDTYHVLTTFPVTKVEDLNGKKIGLPGLTANWLKGTDAVPVRGDLTTYYNSVKTGVYDGLLVFASSVGPYKFYEVAPYVTKVNFGAMYSTVISINQDRWKALPQDVKDVISEVSDEFYKIVAKEYMDRGDASLATAVKGDGKIAEFGAAERKAWAMKLPNLAKAWAADLDKKGQPGTQVLNTYMEIARGSGIKFARDWDKE